MIYFIFSAILNVNPVTCSGLKLSEINFCVNPVEDLAHNKHHSVLIYLKLATFQTEIIQNNCTKV